jgi:hypothetical protein
LELGSRGKPCAALSVEDGNAVIVSSKCIF